MNKYQIRKGAHEETIILGENEVDAWYNWGEANGFDPDDVHLIDRAIDDGYSISLLEGVEPKPLSKSELINMLGELVKEFEKFKKEHYP